MVKTNKKSLIAMIAMVVLLIASIAMGITGAWFTDKEVGSDKTLTFGSIDINLTSGSKFTLDEADLGATATIMPGCEVVYSGAVQNTGEKALVAVIITAELSDGLNWTDVGATDPSSYKVYEMDAKNGSQEITATVKFSEDLKDQAKLTGKSVKLNVSVYAVQYEHYAASNAYTNLSGEQAQAEAIRALAIA